MVSMTRRLGLRHAGCLVFVALPLAAGSMGTPSPAVIAPSEARLQSDSSIVSGSEIVPSSRLDSTRTADSTLVVDSLTAPGPAANAQALAADLERLTVAAASLPPGERRVFDEIVAAAREMLEGGDLDATRLLTADAVDVLRQGSP